MKQQIRTLEQSDLDAVVKLFMSSYADDTWAEKWQPVDAYRRITEISFLPEAIALVYIEDKEILGCIICTLMSWHTGKQLEVKEIFVSPSHQKRGIGNMLIKQVEALVSNLNVTELFLWTKSDPKLISFYEKCGYAVAKDTVQMFKKC
jgi:N-acetylglutamate synthase-like GNAT family acetyltransferase